MTTKKDDTKPDAKAGSKAVTLTARVLVDVRLDNIPYGPNTLVELPAELAESHEEQGTLSTTDAAIEYCKKAGAEVVNHAEAVKAAEAAKAAAKPATKK